MWIVDNTVFPDVLWKGRPLSPRGLGQGYTRKMLLPSLWWMWWGQEIRRMVMVICFHCEKKVHWKISQENLRKGLNKQLFWPLLSSSIKMLRSKNWRMKQPSLTQFSEMNLKKSFDWFTPNCLLTLYMFLVFCKKLLFTICIKVSTYRGIFSLVSFK